MPSAPAVPRGASAPAMPRLRGDADARALPIVPRVLRRELAAIYVGMGATTFDAEVAAGRAPRPVHVTAGVKGWDRFDLDAWIEDRKAAQAGGENPWDQP